MNNMLKAYEQEIYDGMLMDIAFDMRQGAMFKKIRHNHLFGKEIFESLNTSVNLIREHKERVINDYTTKYSKKPDIEHAKRLFADYEEKTTK